MRITRLLASLVFFAATLAPAAASPFVEAAIYLDGVWTGDGFVLRVDAARAQASVDAERPFNWTRFLVKEVTPEEIVFTVGAELFEARVADDDAIVLTSTSFRGELTITREDASPLDDLRR